MLPRAHLTELRRAGGETIGILCEIGILENDAARQTSHSGAHSAYLFRTNYLRIEDASRNGQKLLRGQFERINILLFLRDDDKQSQEKQLNNSQENLSLREIVPFESENTITITYLENISIKIGVYRKNL